MLTVCRIQDAEAQRRILDRFDPLTQTWIVSDLNSKLDLTRRLLQTRDFIPGTSVLRASELWRQLATRLRPDLQIISKEFGLTLISQRLALMSEDWMRSPGAPKTAYEYLTQLMPILSHPTGPEMVGEWFKENSASESRWGKWYTLARELWDRFVSEGFLAPPWICGVLINEEGLTQAWLKPMIVELGAELNQVEADILLRLGEVLDLTVLQPDPVWGSEYKKTLVAYKLFEKALTSRSKPASAQKIELEPATPLLAQSRSAEDPSSVFDAKIEFRRYTTMIAEVKAAVAQIRSWLDTNPQLQANDVAVVAPDIELFWPALLSYFETEGLPVQKEQVRRLHSFPDIYRWLSRMRLKTGSSSEADLETGLFGPHGRIVRSISYERFRTLFTAIYEREDFSRAEHVSEKFSVKLDLRVEIRRDDFVAWSLLQLPAETPAPGGDTVPEVGATAGEPVDFERLESLFKKVFAECPQSTSLLPEQWVHYLERTAARVECRLRDGAPDGVECLNLASSEHSQASKMIMIGLTEVALRQTSSTAVLYSDVLSLAGQLGFHLASEDQAKLEFKARWVMSDHRRSRVCCVAETDFAGGVQAASWLWVRGASASGAGSEISLAPPTRWDELQRASLDTLARERHFSRAQRFYLEERLSCDLGMAEPETFAGGLITTLSPSAIENYLDCPFIFAARRVFRLSDVAELDLEVDPSRRGSLMHKMLELLTGEPLRFDYTTSELESIVDRARVLSRLELADERLWAPLRARYSDLATRFLEFEREHRLQFPKTRTVGREFDIAGFVSHDGDEETSPLSPSEESGSLKFVGSIDRIDEDSAGNLLIMDYKSSSGSVGQFGSWLKKNQIQLLLYSMAVERGLTALSPRPVIGALYYVLRPMGRDNGFKVLDIEQELVEVGSGRKQNKITLAEKQSLFKEGEKLLKSAVTEIRRGNFKPNPRDKKLCADCQWSALCRAPHLNI